MTHEEILKKHAPGVILFGIAPGYSNSDVINAMEEYARQYNTEMLTAFLIHFYDHQKTYKDWKHEDIVNTFIDVWTKVKQK